MMYLRSVRFLPITARSKAPEYNRRFASSTQNRRWIESRRKFEAPAEEIGYFPDLHAAVFKQQVLFSHGAVCLVRRDHPLYAHGITFAQYRAARHLVVVQESRSQDVIDQALSEHGIVRNIVLTISHFVNVPPLIARSDLVATLPRPVAARSSQFYPLTLLEVPFPIASMEIKQVWHLRFHNSPKLIWLRHLVAEMSQNKPSM